MKHESNGDTDSNYSTWDNSQRITKGSGGLGNNRTNGDIQTTALLRIDQNTEKSPRD